mmetsp:Transcript_33730/g.54122  ORF Transcript_33730/g.54122 Transcript_33730/m.54122 type:complete len:1070 (-) Transcript_33730:936-4145(-)|eukprot:CAMPEP_0203747856 /NCGR_PEP_ID=MMETSP0098-20131031/2891_1 /ASSEMBLY_ACC=CAM_ASM_000208 /TAXON_ID=96639 /ORGANISM=" , Strain NY0313808BC1" /LENGTH=1069 /DNA_ID=CAMNT_0050636421 /DNA_START=1086 /DNA_END=4295 /DNA_ORIENTATION=-
MDAQDLESLSRSLLETSDLGARGEQDEFVQGDDDVESGSALGSRLKRSNLVRRIARTKFDILDHFTLRSSLYRYQDKIVLEGGSQQLIFWVGEEEQENLSTHEKKSERVLISVRLAKVYGGWVYVLRFIYMYVVLFLAGVAVVFCILVFVHFGLGVFLVGIRSVNGIEERVATLLTVLAVPTFVQFLSILVTLIIGFLDDVWNDFEFFNTMTMLNSMVRDWIVLLGIILVPLATFSISFIVAADSPVTNMMLSSLICTGGLFALVCVYTIWLEVYSCVKIIQTCIPQAATLRDALSCLIRLRVHERFALTFRPGVDSDEEVFTLDEVDDLGMRPLGFFCSLFYRPVRLRRLWSLESVLKPRPILSRKGGSVLFFCCLSGSRFRGSLSRSSLRSSFICTVITGFLIWLVFLGYLIYSTFITPLLVVLLGGGSFILLIVWVYRAFLGVEAFKRETVKMHANRREQRRVSEVGNNPFSSFTNPFHSEGDEELGQRPLPTPQAIDMDAYNEYKSASEARYVYAIPRRFASVLFSFFVIAIFLLLPFYGFAKLGVGGYGMFFLFAVLLTLLRFVFNVRSLLEVFGTRAIESLELPIFDGVLHEAQEISESDEETVPSMNNTPSFCHPQFGVLSSPERQKKSAAISDGGRRIYLLLTRMAKPQIKLFWVGSLGLAAIIMILLVAFSVDTDTSKSNYEGLPLYGNASHPTYVVPTRSRMDRGFMYPSCTLFEDLYGPEKHNSISWLDSDAKTNWYDAAMDAYIRTKPPPPSWSTLDFAFLSDLAYSKAETTQEQLDRWFTPAGIVEYIPPKDYPKYAAKKRSSAVFKLVKTKRRVNYRDITREVDFFLVSVRGTINTYDLLSDMQMWFPAMLFQYLRFIIPFGSMWDGVIPFIVKWFGLLETQPANKVSYESDISNFVRELKRKNPGAHIALTGHSLGGGLVLITGAREKIPAVGISAPNAVISRLKFGLSKSNLDAFTINVIPRGDPIPYIDDHALLTENVLCRIRKGESAGACHSVQRTICEIQHVCGSGFRPPLAECNKTYGYPDPIPVKGRPEEQIAKAARDIENTFNSQLS